MPPNCVKVDRTTKWGNPFVVGEHGTREECVHLFRLMCAGHICLSAGPGLEVQRAYIEHAKKYRHTLRGKDLACWCPASVPCHAAVLLEVAANS